MKNPVESLLEADHESLGKLLSKLDALLAEPDIARALDLLDLFWARLAVHIRAEHLHLFPAIASADTSLFTGKGSLPTSEEAHNVLMHLRADHDSFMKELGQMMRVARELVGREESPHEEIKYLRQRMTDIRKRLETHNQLEEKQVYTWPSLLFDQETVAALRDGFRHELENLPPRFAKTT
jgi:hypothetical protein